MSSIPDEAQPAPVDRSAPVAYAVPVDRSTQAAPVDLCPGRPEWLPEDLGLRLRKKLATREALSGAALRLALERGPENVRVDDIAAAAGVSPRTYNNYFSCREEAICVALATERAQGLAAALSARPDDEPLVDAIIGAVMDEHTGDRAPDRNVMRLIAESPLLRGEFLKAIIAIERPLGEAIARRRGPLRAAGSNTTPDLFARVLAAAVASAVRVATEQWLRRPDTDVPLASVVRAALASIAPAMRDYEVSVVPLLSDIASTIQEGPC